MHLRVYFILIFISSLSFLNSTTLTLDIRSSVSSIVLEPDSVVVYNKTEDISYTFTKTNELNLDIITSIDDELESNYNPFTLNIYSYNGQLIKTNFLGKQYVELSGVFKELNSGLYLIERQYLNGEIVRNVVFLDAYLNQFKSNTVSLNYLLEKEYDISIYKHGYGTITLDNIKVNMDEKIPLLLTPEFDKFYNRIVLSINGIWKEGKVNSEVTENGNQKYSTNDVKSELKDEIDFKNTELRELNDACYDKVMEGINKNLKCSEDFPIKEDSIYFCGLECSKPSNSYSELYANTVYAIFNESKDTIQFLNFHYRIGSFEESGYPSKKQEYKSVDIALSNLPFVEDSDKYTITLVNSQIRNHISFFYWNEFYDGIDFHPPFNRGKSTTNYNGDLDIKSDAKIELIIYKSK
ncbi:MAG: hypothetical protein CVV25_10905 [Ignavibacteriae bacterium HGW-Ignavibacteriae-4]|jgi:hypothetical protein|nr:MAG: hypothetical protein CVV25_10905 [Ignavibacteriae bacterium HGW-Ignavibacteriae-4]